MRKTGGWGGKQKHRGEKHQEQLQPSRKSQTRKFLLAGGAARGLLTAEGGRNVVGGEKKAAATVLTPVQQFVSRYRWTTVGTQLTEPASVSELTNQHPLRRRRRRGRVMRRVGQGWRRGRRKRRGDGERRKKKRKEKRRGRSRYRRTEGELEIREEEEEEESTPLDST